MHAHESNLSHALNGMCSDPDCELHHIEVAIREEVVDPTNVAFFLAGADRMIAILKSFRDDSAHDGESPLLDLTDLTDARAQILDLVKGG